jgi:hypothetical protein
VWARREGQLPLYWLGSWVVDPTPTLECKYTFWEGWGRRGVTNNVSSDQMPTNCTGNDATIEKIFTFIHIYVLYLLDHSIFFFSFRLPTLKNLCSRQHHFVHFATNARTPIQQAERERGRREYYYCTVTAIQPQLTAQPIEQRHVSIVPLHIYIVQCNYKKKVSRFGRSDAASLMPIMVGLFEAAIPFILQ